jgi:hypothetical protein
MLSHWKEKVFKDGEVPYWLLRCVMVGPSDSEFMDSVPRIEENKVEGDAVILVGKRREDGGTDSEVVMAICSDGTWIKGLSS